jgi:hypothetical protein
LGVATCFDTIVQETEKTLTTNVTTTSQHYYTTTIAVPIAKTQQ